MTYRTNGQTAKPAAARSSTSQAMLSQSAYGSVHGCDDGAIPNTAETAAKYKSKDTTASQYGRAEISQSGPTNRRPIHAIPNATAAIASISHAAAAAATAASEQKVASSRQTSRSASDA